MNFETEFPSIVRIELTNGCNLQCPHCRHHAPDKKLPENYPDYYVADYEMSRLQIDSLLEEAASFNSSITLNVANEPTIAKNFLYAVTRIKELGLSGTFNTNGVKLTTEMCQTLVDKEFDSINISIDASTPQTLKKARGFSNLELLIKNVERLVQIRGDKALPRIGVTFVLMPYNKDEVQSFIEFWKSRVDVIRFTGYITDGRPDVSVLPGVEMTEIPDRVPCKQIFNDIVIRANGDVTPCVITSEAPDYLSMGNVFDDGGISAVWNGYEFLRWRDAHLKGSFGNLPYCENCDYWLDSLRTQEKEIGEFLIRSTSPYTVFYNVKDRLQNWDREKLVPRQSFASNSNAVDVETSYKLIDLTEIQDSQG